MLLILKGIGGSRCVEIPTGLATTHVSVECRQVVMFPRRGNDMYLSIALRGKHLFEDDVGEIIRRQAHSSRTVLVR